MIDPIIRVLGEVGLRDGEAAGPLSAQPRRLLLRLAIHYDQPVHKDRLEQALWGDGSGPDDRGADRGVRLRMAVSRLRKRIIDSGLGDAIHFAQDSYTLRVDPVTIDAELFTALVDEARRLAPAIPDRAAELLAEAFELWPAHIAAFGSLASEPWSIGPAAHLEELRLGAEEDWAAIELARGRHSSVVDRLHTAARRAPLREARWVQLATALYRSGRQADALRALHEARTLLHEEVGVEPGQELRRLEHTILDQHQSTIDHLPHVPTHAVGPAPIGRAQELAAVEALVRANRVVTIVGLGGVGKTMLARTLASVTYGTATPAMLIGLDGLGSSSEILLAIAGRLGIGSGDADEATLLSAIAGRLQRTPLLVLDGAEANPAAVAEVVESLGVGSSATRVLITARVPIGAVGEVRYTLEPLAIGSLGEPGPAVSLFLLRAGISAADLADHDVATVIRVCERTAGLPLAIELVASSLDRYGLRELDASVEDLGLPVRTALKASLDVLPIASRDLLLDIALLPDGVSLDLAAELAAVDGSQIRTVLGPLAQVRLLETRNDPGSIRYRPLEPVREAAIELGADDELAPRRVYDVLFARARAVGDICDIPHIDALAGVEAELGNLRYWLERTLGTVAGLELATAVSLALIELGADQEAHRWLLAHRAALANRDELLELRSLIAVSNSGGFGAGPQLSVESLEWAVATAERLELWPLWCFALAYLAIAKVWAGDVEAGYALLVGEESLARLAEVGNEWFETHRLRLVAYGKSTVGMFAEARSDMEGLPERFEALDDPSNALVTRYLAASAARLAGDADQAGHDLHAARAGARPGVRRGLLAIVDAELAHLARADGDAAATTRLEDAVADLELAGNVRMAAVNRRDLARWRLADGDPTRALQDLRAALPVLLRNDRRGASLGLATVATIIADEQPDAAARLATVAQRWLEHEPGGHPAADDAVWISEVAARLAPGAADVDAGVDADVDEVLALVLATAV